MVLKEKESLDMAFVLSCTYCTCLCGYVNSFKKFGYFSLIHESIKNYPGLSMAEVEVIEIRHC